METVLHNGNLSGSRDQDELSKIMKTTQDFVNEFPKWERRMNRHMRELREIANGIDRYHKGATIANVTGSSLGAAGGVLSLAGIITAPFTAGISLVLTAVGASIGGLGGVTNLTAGITENVTQSMEQKKVDEIIRQYESDQKEILENLTDIRSVLQILSCLVEEEITKPREKLLPTVNGRLHLPGASKARNVLKIGEQKCPYSVKAALQCVSIGKKTAKVAESIAAKQVLSKTIALKELAKKLTALSRTARNTKYAVGTKNVEGLLHGTPLAVSRTTTAVSGVLGAIFIAVDIYSIAKNSIQLSKGSKSEVAEKIRDEAQKIEDALKFYRDICQILKWFLKEIGSRHY